MEGRNNKHEHVVWYLKVMQRGFHKTLLILLALTVLSASYAQNRLGVRRSYPDNQQSPLAFEFADMKFINGLLISPVQHKANPFEAWVMCGQSAVFFDQLNNAIILQMSYTTKLAHLYWTNRDGVLLSISRRNENLNQIWNYWRQGARAGNIIFEFSNEIAKTIHPTYAFSSDIIDFAVIGSDELIHDLLTAHKDVLMTLEGTEGIDSIRIPIQALSELKAGFGKTCLE